MRITVHNRGPDGAPMHVLPQLWFRNTWSLGRGRTRPALAGATATAVARRRTTSSAAPRCRLRRRRRGCCSPTTRPTAARLFGVRRPSGLIQGRLPRLRRRRATRTRSIPQRRHQGGRPVSPATLPARRQRSSVRAAPDAGQPAATRSRDFDAVFAAAHGRGRRVLRRRCSTASPTRTSGRVQRQALAGMLWSKQFYHLRRARSGSTAIRRSRRRPRSRKTGRNADWRHLDNADVISMPDKWEYPWYAAWDLAFHCVPLALVDPDFAKQQLAAADARMVHAPERPAARLRVGVRRRQPAGARLGGLRVFQIDRRSATAAPATATFLERVFHKLLLNFTWWVNRKDARGPQRLPGRLPRPRQHRRLRPLHAAADRRHIDQADGTAGWRCTAST